MSSCRSSSFAVEYDSCDYYCLAEGQSVGTLAECLIRASVPDEVWCNTDANATATATATATGTGVVTLSATTTDADSTGAIATSTVNAVRVLPPRPLSKSAICMVGLLLAGSAAGIFI